MLPKATRTRAGPANERPLSGSEGQLSPNLTAGGRGVILLFVRLPRDEREASAWVSAARLSSLGIYMAACIGLGGYLGTLGDRKWDTGSILTIVGFLVGTVAAFYGLFRELGRTPPSDGE